MSASDKTACMATKEVAESSAGNAANHPADSRTGNAAKVAADVPRCGFSAYVCQVPAKIRTNALAPVGGRSW